MSGRHDIEMLRGMSGSGAGFDPRGVSQPLLYQYGMQYPGAAAYMPMSYIPPPPPTQPPPTAPAPPPPPPPPTNTQPPQPQSQPQSQSQPQQLPTEQALQKWQSLQQSRNGVQQAQFGSHGWRPSLDFGGNRKPRLDGKARFNAYKRTQVRPEFNHSEAPGFADSAQHAPATANSFSQVNSSSNSDMNANASSLRAQMDASSNYSTQVSSHDQTASAQWRGVDGGSSANTSSSRKQNKIGFRTRWNAEQTQTSGPSTPNASLTNASDSSWSVLAQRSGNLAAGAQNFAAMKQRGFANFPQFGAFVGKSANDIPQSTQSTTSPFKAGHVASANGDRNLLGKWSDDAKANANTAAQWRKVSGAGARLGADMVSNASSQSAVGVSALSMNVNELPESLRRFVARALDSVERTDHDAMLAVLHPRLREVIVSGRASEIDWDKEPIPPLLRPATAVAAKRSRSKTPSVSHSRSIASRSRTRSSTSNSNSNSRSPSRSRSSSSDPDSSHRKRRKRKSEGTDGSRTKRSKKGRKDQKRKEDNVKKRRRRRASRAEDFDDDRDRDRERDRSESDDELSSSRGSRTRVRGSQASPNAARAPTCSPVARGRGAKAMRRGKAAARGRNRNGFEPGDHAALQKRAARFAAHLGSEPDSAGGVRSRLGATVADRKRQGARGGFGLRLDGSLSQANDSHQSLLIGTGFSAQFGEDSEENLDLLFAQNRIVGTSQALEKQYLRLTAPPEPSSVRPLAVLRRSAALLAARWRSDKSAASAAHVCEQLKSIRQDLTVQCIRNAFTVKIYEMHARICLEVGHREEFNQCQSQLKQLYDDGIVYEERAGASSDEEDDEEENEPVAASDERAKIRGNQLEFLAYRILYCLFTNQLRNLTQLMSSLCRMRLDRLIGMEINITAAGCSSSAYVRASEQERCLRFALEVRRAYMIGSWSRIFALYADAPRNTRYLLEWLFEQRLRRIALTHVQKACRPDVPLEWLSKQLCFSDNEACQEFLKENQASVSGDNLVCTKMK